MFATHPSSLEFDTRKVSARHTWSSGMLCLWSGHVSSNRCCLPPSGDSHSGMYTVLTPPYNHSSVKRDTSNCTSAGLVPAGRGERGGGGDSQRDSGGPGGQKKISIDTSGIQGPSTSTFRPPPGFMDSDKPLEQAFGPLDMEVRPIQPSNCPLWAPVPVRTPSRNPVFSHRMHGAVRGMLVLGISKVCNNSRQQCSPTG